MHSYAVFSCFCTHREGERVIVRTQVSSILVNYICFIHSVNLNVDCSGHFCFSFSLVPLLVSWIYIEIIWLHLPSVYNQEYELIASDHWPSTNNRNWPKWAISVRDSCTAIYVNAKRSTTARIHSQACLLTFLHCFLRPHEEVIANMMSDQFISIVNVWSV